MNFFKINGLFNRVFNLTRQETSVIRCRFNSNNNGKNPVGDFRTELIVKRIIELYKEINSSGYIRFIQECLKNSDTYNERKRNPKFYAIRWKNMIFSEKLKYHDEAKMLKTEKNKELNHILDSLTKDEKEKISAFKSKIIKKWQETSVNSGYNSETYHLVLRNAKTYNLALRIIELKKEINFSGYILFIQECFKNSETVNDRESNPEKMTDYAKKWKNMSYSEKLKYNDEAKMLKTESIKEHDRILRYLTKDEKEKIIAFKVKQLKKELESHFLRFKSIKNPDQKIMSPYQDPLKDISIYHRNIS